jgi:TRAP-type mannitol/chloroaromatic compound transport system permease small subunit
LKGKNNRLVRSIRNLTGWMLAASGLMILFMALTATYGVTRRYLLHNPEPYSYEIGIMLLLWCFVLSVAAVQNEERHLRGDFILNRLPRKVRKFINGILSPALAVLCSSILAWKGWEAALFSLRIGERSISSWAEPLFPVKIVIPAGYGLLLLAALMQVVQGMAAAIHGDRENGNDSPVGNG